MLTMSKMSAEQAAGYYFGADALNYYAGEKGQHCPLFGRLSNVIFGKNSEIDSGQQQADFREWLEGGLPPRSGIKGEEYTGRDGKTYLKNPKAKGRKVGAYDLTFSAPKGVSALWAMCAAAAQDGDKAAQAKADEIRAAMRRANDYAMTLVEQLAEQNQKIGGVLKKTPSGGILAVQFEHDDARPTADGDVDPQLHIHNVIMNMTLGADGQIRSLDMKKWKKYEHALGQAFRNRLKEELERIGVRCYDVDINDGKEKSFRVAFGDEPDFDAKLERFFGGRSREIDRAYRKAKDEGELADVPEHSAKNIINQTIKRRKAQKLSRTHWIHENGRRLEREGHQPKKLWKSAVVGKFQGMMALGWSGLRKTFNMEEELDIGALMQAAAKKRLIEISKTANTVTHAQIMTAVLAESGADWEQAEQFCTAFLRKNCQEKGDRFVLNSAVSRENKLLDKIQKLKTMTVNQSLIPEEANIGSIPEIAQSGCSLEQFNLIDALARGRQKILCIQGYAGTGKSYAVKLVKEIHQQFVKNGGEGSINGFAFMAKTAGDLESGTGVASQTIDKMLLEWEKNGKPSSDGFELLIFDESSMIDAEHALRLFEYLEARPNARAVFMGDTEQFGSVGAGRFFGQLQESGVDTVYLRHIRRQKTRETKSVVRNFKQGDLERMFSYGRRRRVFEEQRDPSFMLQKMAQEYAERKAAGEEAIMLAGTNSMRHALNAQARKILHAGRPAEEACRASQKRVVETAAVASRIAEGQAVFFSYKGREYRVEGMNPLSFPPKKNPFGQEIKKAMKKGELTFYTRSEMELFSGEEVIFNKNFRGKFKNRDGKIVRTQISNGNMATVTGFDEEKGEFYLQFDGESEEIVLNMQDGAFFDYAYCITDYKSQGISVDHVFVAADSAKTSAAAFYVQCTRAKESLKVYATDLDGLKTKLAQSMGQDPAEQDPLSMLDRKQARAAAEQARIAELEEEYRQLAAKRKLDYLLDAAEMAGARAVDGSLSLPPASETLQSEQEEMLKTLLSAEGRLVRITREEAEAIIESGRVREAMAEKYRDELEQIFRQHADVNYRMREVLQSAQMNMPIVRYRDDWKKQTDAITKLILEVRGATFQAFDPVTEEVNGSPISVVYDRLRSEIERLNSEVATLERANTRLEAQRIFRSLDSKRVNKDDVDNVFRYFHNHREELAAAFAEDRATQSEFEHLQERLAAKMEAFYPSQQPQQQEPEPRQDFAPAPPVPEDDDYDYEGGFDMGF